MFPPPPVPGLGTRRLQAAGPGPRRARAPTRCTRRPQQRHRRRRTQDPRSPACSPASRSTCRSSYVDVDREQAPRRRACRSTDVFETLQVYLGLALRQRLQPLRPHLPGDRAGRRRSSASHAEDIGQLKTRNAPGEMVPLGSLADGAAETSGPDRGQPLQRSTRPPTSTAARRRASAPGRRWPRWSDPGARRCRRDALRVDRADLPADARGQHGAAASSRCACCSCS